MTFYSKRNRVTAIQYQGQPCVEKRFQSDECWKLEYLFYNTFGKQLSIPRLCRAEPGLLIMEYLPFPTLVEILEAQESSSFDAAPWTALGQWILQCHKRCGMIPGDGNLRNFLWNSTEQRIIGLDFEEYRLGSVADAGSQLIGFLLEYHPRGTTVKAEVAQILQTTLHVSDSEIAAAQERILQRRTARKQEGSL